MFDEYEPMKKMNDAEITSYLKRIGYEGSRTPTKELLDELICLHQSNVPFETLDCHDFRMEIDLHPDVLFDKIVNRNRGGYCLELNGSFYRLLISLGFTARPCMCRVLLGAPEYTHPIDHRGTFVTIDDHIYFCDVGLGGPMPPAGLDITAAGWQELRGERFCVKPDVPGWYAICRESKGKSDVHSEDDSVTTRIEILFTDITCYETDFMFLNHYMSTHPEALHVQHRILNMRTPEGYRMIWDDVYKEVKDGQVITHPIEGNLKQILAEKFGICVDI